MIYNFQNLAIKCDTWQQMQQLKEIAEKQGLITSRKSFSEKLFKEGECYFACYRGHYFCDSTITYWETPISFTSFITSHPDYQSEGC